MKKLAILVIVLLVLYSGPIVLEKHRIETANKKVELIVDYDLFSDLNQLDLLVDLAADNFSSIAVTEKSLVELASENKLSIYNAWELQGLKNLGVDLAKIDPVKIYISGPMELLKQIKARLNWASINSTSNDGLLIIDRSQAKLLSKPIYFAKEAQSLAYKKDLKLIPRFKSQTTMKELGKTLEQLQGVNTIIFSGEQLPTYPDYLEDLAAMMNNFAVNLGIIEPFLAQQLGSKSLTGLINYQAIRLHSISGQELENLNIKQVVARCLRAVEERNVRLLYIKPFAEEEKSKLLITKLNQNLKEAGYKLGTAKPFEVVTTDYWKFPLAIISLLIAVVVPVVEYIYLLNHSLKEDLIKTYLLFISSSLISIGAGLVITALLFDSSYLLQIKQFRGVKLAFLLPLILSISYLIKINYQSDFKEQIITRFKEPVAWWQMFLGISLLMVVIFYLARTGNQAIIKVSSLELRIREFLAEIFVVRPRFKSFLIGHPVLLLGIYEANSSYSRWLLLVGLIGQINIINTLIHFHMPISISLSRVSLGIVLGAVIGTIMIKIVAIIKLRVLGN